MRALLLDDDDDAGFLEYAGQWQQGECHGHGCMKYRNGNVPTNTRWSMTARNGLFRDTEAVHLMVEALYKLANKKDLTLAELSLAWVYQFPGVTSTIIGATSLQQLKENINAFSVHLDEELHAQVHGIIKAFPMPF